MTLRGKHNNCHIYIDAGGKLHVALLLPLRMHKGTPAAKATPPRHTPGGRGDGKPIALKDYDTALRYFEQAARLLPKRQPDS